MTIEEKIIEMGKAIAPDIAENDVLMSLGWYDFVIKKIPEKKLDKIISLEKPEEMEKLRNI